MSGTLIYLHGFRSAAASEKARATQTYVAQACPRLTLQVPTLSEQPERAIAQIEALVREADPGQPLAFIGSSLGGFYATVAVETFAARARAALINPAVFPVRDLSPYLGRIQNMITGEWFDWSADHLAQLSALEARCRVLRDASRYLLCVETGDAVLPYREACVRYAGARQRVVEGGDHRFQSYERLLPDIFAFLFQP